MTGVLRTPTGATFSKSTSSVNAAITVRFMTPPAKSSSINTQQDARQESPCTVPVRNASVMPGRGPCAANAAGEREDDRHRRLNGKS